MKKRKKSMSNLYEKVMGNKKKKKRIKKINNKNKKVSGNKKKSVRQNKKISMKSGLLKYTNQTLVKVTLPSCCSKKMAQ